MAALRNTINLLMNALQKQGIQNTYVQAGVTAVVGTESDFVPKAEMTYANTPNDRLRLIFGSRVAKYRDDQLTLLKADNIRFFDIVYGGQLGNNLPGDGWKYRGRGYNGITFKDNYARYGKIIGVDLVTNPDRLNDTPIASAALAAFFSDSFKSAETNGSLKSKIGIDTIAEVNDFETGVRVALQANAGWGKDTATTFFKEVYNKALEKLDTVYAIAKRNPAKAAIIGSASVALIFFLGYKLFNQPRNKRGA